MQLNLGTKKNFSEANMRRIISILTGLMSSVSSLEDQCIKEYNDTVTYQKGQIVIGSDGYFYEAKTVATGTWDSSKWTKIGTDDITELSKDDISALINLSPEEISKLSDIISTEIRLDKTFSSSDTYMRIQAAIDTAKEYTNNQLGKAVKPAYKVVSSTSEVTETGYFYLISNGTNFDMYVLSSDGSVVSLGTSEIDLSNYYTKTETDSDFLKKTDATSTYATITTVDGKVDKTSIATAISSTPSVDKVASEKAVYDKNTINHKIIQGIDILDYASKVVDNFEFVRGFNVINSPYNDSVSPNNDMLYIINRIAVTGYCRLVAYDLRSTFAYMRTQLNGTWTDWVRLTVAGGTEDYQTLATPQIKDGAFMSNSVLWGTDRDFLVLDINKPDRTVRRVQFDTVEKAIGMYDLDYDTNTITEVGTLRFTKNSYVPVTNIAPADETTFVNFKGNPNCNYCVKNGVCYVSLFNIKITSVVKTTTGVILPKCLNGMVGTFLTGNGDVTPHAYVHVIPGTGELAFDVKDANTNLFGSFSYPVAKS